MDTRFWGPSGWHLLHLIAAAPVDRDRRANVKEWFGLLEYVLPCKYCRASFHDYTRLQPLTDMILASSEQFGHWLYDIHNRVNGKLRGQGLLTSEDPSWPSVRAKFTEQEKTLCKGSPLLGWDFMTSVAFSTPTRDYAPVPMADTPDERSDCLSFAERNRYNLLTRKERITALKRWWRLIPSILPCAPWRQAWSSALRASGSPPLSSGREAVMRWMWRVEERVCDGLKCPTPHPSLPAMTKEVAAFESGCGKDKRGKTCRTRKRKPQRRQTIRNRGRDIVV